ncbi:hypothetical protein G6F35_016790 [Rhizopus arrhizus]|nr:hypothetical protein G6F35_016790 [Rhizopus arrhizus]
MKADHLVGAEFAQGVQAVAFAVRGDDPRAGGMRHLDGQRADTAATAMDQHGLPHAQAAQFEQVVPDGEQAFRQGARLGVVQRPPPASRLMRRCPRKASGTPGPHAATSPQASRPSTSVTPGAGLLTPWRPCWRMPSSA